MTEDRRAPQELAEALRVRAGYLSGRDWEAPATAAMMREAAAELSRLSRVEQALREQFTNLLASATQLVDSHPGRFRYLEYDVRALSASPEVQPKEDHGRLLRSIPSEWADAANAARGLCESEARRWETQSPKTAEHWRKVAVSLGALYLTQDHLASPEAQPKEDQ